MDKKDFLQYLHSLTPSEFENVIQEYNKQHNTQFNLQPTDTVVGKLETLKEKTKCPYCDSSIIVRRGKDKHQRFRCEDCKRSFSAITNTLIDNSTFTWEQWVKLLHLTIIGCSLKDTVNIFKKDYGLDSLAESTIQIARHKIFHFVSLLPQPNLSGTIQIDETYFRENQKASKSLENYIPSVVEYRKARYGKQPSALGVMGNEFATVVVAADSSGHIVAKVACMGRLTVPIFYDLFHTHFVSPAYICTDGNQIFKEYCLAVDYPHYVRESDYLATIMREGYDFPRYPNDELNMQAVAMNDTILEKLYNNGVIDRINNRGHLTYKEFKRIKKEYKLSLARVNQQHNELKKFINTNKTGVSSKFLDKYVSFYAFIHNWRVDHDIFPSALSDAEEILNYLLKYCPPSTFTAEDYKNTELKLPKPSKRYIQYLATFTSEARQAFDLKYLKLNEEDGVHRFNKREYLLDCPRTWIVDIAKKNGIKATAKSSIWNMVRAIMKLPNIDTIIVELLLRDKNICIEKEDNDLLRYFKIDPEKVAYNEKMEDNIKKYYPAVLPSSPIFNGTTYYSPSASPTEKLEGEIVAEYDSNGSDTEDLPFYFGVDDKPFGE